MIDKLLKAKHWQLFILMLGIPILFQIVLMGTIFSNINSESTSETIAVFNYMKYFPVMMLIYICVFFGWFWSIAIGLQKKIPDSIKMNVTKFKIFFFFALTYLTILSVLIGISFAGLVNSAGIISAGLIQEFAVVIIPFHFFSMFCMFYMLYFVSKTIKTAELQREVTFGDYAGDFFMLWFYPIGIWIIQPKLNTMVSK